MLSAYKAETEKSLAQMRQSPLSESASPHFISQLECPATMSGLLKIVLTNGEYTWNWTPVGAILLKYGDNLSYLFYY